MPQRPDVSNYLAHFTKNPTSNDCPDSPYATMSAKERLISILQEFKINAANLPWTGAKAVCFTECPWTSLLAHAEQYSPYGVGFAKPRVFVAGGGPAYYVRPDFWESQDWESNPLRKAFATPFCPHYASPAYRRNHWNNSFCDYSHEREWRVPHDFTFKLSQVEFVILNTYEDMASFPRELKDEIGREKFLIMDNYRKIEQLWPVHR